MTRPSTPYHWHRRLAAGGVEREAAIAVDRKIGSVPFRSIGGVKADAIAWLDAEFEKGLGEAGGAAKSQASKRYSQGKDKIASSNMTDRLRRTKQDESSDIKEFRNINNPEIK